MNIFIPFVRTTIRSTLRQLYWLYKAAGIKGGANASVLFPFIVEGRGKISIGKSAKISKRVALRVAEGSELSIGTHCSFENDADIRVGESASLKVGNFFKIASGSRVFVNNEWLFEDEVSIATNCSIFSREVGLYGKLLIQKRSFIGDGCIIDVSGDVTIGSGVGIGPNCIIYTHDHNYAELDKPAWDGGKYYKPVVIKEEVWVGSNVTILGGVVIGKHSVIAAGSVVTKNVPDYTIWAGVPAKQIKVINCTGDEG